MRIMAAMMALAAAGAFAPSLTQADGKPDFALFGLHSICVAPRDGGGSPVVAPAQNILTGYGSGGFKIHTNDPKAQAFFDNGMQLGHAFAHKDSIAAFKEARRLDPDCAMCAWGEAWARGPTINYAIDDKQQAELAALAAKASELSHDGSDVERGLIGALKLRYTHGGGAGVGDYAYADAMDRLAKAHPADSEIAILAADAWMIPASMKNNRQNLPWATELIQGVLAREPSNSAAIHFYIHVTEMSGVGPKALPYAEKLQDLAPAASHLVHMPSHTYFWVGEYQKAVASNLDAAVLDEADARRSAQIDGWDRFYYGHNVQFGIGGALMSGDAASGLKLAQDTLAHTPRGLGNPAFAQMGKATALFAQGRFEDPAKVMASAEPDQPLVRAMWRYARGEAAARTGDAKAVRAEADKIVISGGDLKPFGEFSGQVRSLVDVAHLVLQGRAAMLENKPLVAAPLFRKAAEIQEKAFVTFTDPPVFWYPPRRSLAAAELAAGQADNAAQEAREVLKHWPNDPMSLTVLAEAERKLGKTADADRDLASARRGWKGDPAATELATI
jgi:tetratricopeptide (TPR) repeat protein